MCYDIMTEKHDVSTWIIYQDTNIYEKNLCHEVTAGILPFWPDFGLLKIAMTLVCMLT